MVAKALFVRLPASQERDVPPDMVTVHLNGTPLQVPTDTSLAAGLLAAGITRFRNASVSGAPRAPYCMMGVCFECLVEIDDVPSQQACLVRPREGMRIRTMDALPGALVLEASEVRRTADSANGEIQ